MKPYEDNYVDRTFLESLGELSWIVSCHDHDEPASSPSLLPAKLKLTLILSVTNANFHAYDAWQVSHMDGQHPLHLSSSLQITKDSVVVSQHLAGA